MSKRSLIFAATLVASISLAGNSFAGSSPFKFYAGGQGGYSRITDLPAVGFGGSGFFGVGGSSGILHGAIEAEVGYDGAQWDASSSFGAITTTLELETRLTYGVGIRIGEFVADDLFVYGRVGWVRTNFESTITIADATTSVSASADDDADGLRLGGGLEVMLADNVGVRGDYTYTIYDSSIFGNVFNLDVNQHLFRIGVAYYF